jgi:hypothetical protein
MEDAENARRMLTNPAILRGAMGTVLAEYLVEYLPFETETDKMAESVRLVLQPGLIDEQRRLDLWKKSTRKQAYLVGFLQAVPDALPEPEPARTDYAANAQILGFLAEQGNSCAALLLRVLSSPGQTFLSTVAKILLKPPTQDVVHASFDVLRDYFSSIRPTGDPDLTFQELAAEAPGLSDDKQASEEVRACLETAPNMGAEIAAMRVLSGLGYGVLRPMLRDTTAIGTLMRRKLKPVLDPILERLELLRRA